MPVTEIKSYDVAFYAGDRTNRVRANVTLFDAKKGKLATLSFIDEGNPLPANSIGSSVSGYYPTALYPAIVDMLRNENPVYLTTGGKTDVGIGTGMEPTGDGEGVKKIFGF